MPVQYRTIIGSFWLWMPILLAAWVIPLIFWKRRLGYAAFWCFCLAVAVAALWRHDWDGINQITLGFRTKHDGILLARTLAAQTSRGGIMLAWSSGVDRVPENFQQFAGSPVFSWTWDPVSGYPDPSGPGATVKYGGFIAMAGNWPDDPTRPQVQRQFWALVLPDWFAIGVLAITPFFWAYKTIWNKQRYRRKRNLCLTCGYSLQGLPQPIVCPECGNAESEMKLA